MKVIISPAKKMVVNLDDFDVLGLPMYLDQATEILAALRQLSYDQLKQLWHASEKLTQASYDQLQQIDLHQRLTPAILSFSGIQYQYMAPDLLSKDGLDYLQGHLRILSGLYGILQPFDGVVPYRFDMDSRLAIGTANNMYQYWGDRIYRALADDGPIINLASQEYSKTITKFLKPDDQFIGITFGHLVDGQIKTRATFAKMARGEMVRFMAERHITDVAELTQFDSPNYQFDEANSTDTNLVFLRQSAVDK
ncbi:hypothetical protein FAM21834_00525 [Lentilactobacillus parabuchneri]|jgi:cytoplasmic iron level regulating protein YaaA (DUF328/UPF0246 family)|uniref:UPF0246 protein FAM23169_00538 n=2 Tax=Lentilactobacillus parabuchneri TaxID=152331 RepID=A0A1X1FH38_9LACO|nr:peroxide stress protein YaaA [Lentilactobacillus parabuchneri]APR06799.1 hypothetical protein FAM21731_00586 [Lentilactobacillus parabuchneri]KRM46882.1 hypothetical protein FC51_GL001795 [Lentilactobacillus parabuchneri DSM 5707 = NBRC 107865]KRN76598.1 hypothetical protein IV42_GL000074 [Lentilactobacillus parabuchneri]MBW0222587.1 peroxide stress protein YaaA [Lentilactobacillus parabuchneri]MBW0245825.1 peroxide stress protein YaaA [Lentilactobacillus parabuchneri]